MRESGFSLRVFSNWNPALYGNSWYDVTDTMIGDALPSIQLSAERGDIPLTTTASDLSLTVNNADDRWDNIFDVSKIVGAIPPVQGTVLRAPLVHYGQVLLCRQTFDPIIPGEPWQVLFYGFVNPQGVRFNRTAKTVTFTAFAPCKLLEHGNAERVNRMAHTTGGGLPVALARPFVLTDMFLIHPTTPPGGSAVNNAWWKLAGGATVTPTGGGFILIPGDVFQPIHAIPLWVENMKTRPFGSDQYHVVTVLASGNDLFFQTAGSPTLILGSGAANLEHLNPWFLGSVWEALVQSLVAEANAGLAAEEMSDALVVTTTGLPLLTTTGTDSAQLIYVADVTLPVTGMAYGIYSGANVLLFSGQAVDGKADILAPNTIPPPTLTAPNFSPPAGGSNGAGPDEGQSEKVLPPQTNVAGQSIDFSTTGNLPRCGRDLHQFNLSGLDSTLYYHSVHWSHTATKWTDGLTPKRFYRAWALGKFFGTSPSRYTQGIQIDEFTTSDGGATWTRASTASNSSVHTVNTPEPQPVGVDPSFGRSARISLKVFQLGAGSFLYCWNDPYLLECYAKTNATDDLGAGSLIPPPASFIASGGLGSPILASSFVNEGANGAVWFFVDRADRAGVDLWYWNGSVMALGSIVDSTNQGLVLIGGDFINAIVDPTRTPKRLYVIVGNQLYAMQYSWSAPTLTITAWQTVFIDKPNYDPATELLSLNSSTPQSVAWLTGPVLQANAGEPNYPNALDAVIVGTTAAIYIVSDTPSNIVDVADFEGQSVAAALDSLLTIRGYQMLSGADKDFVPDPATYTPVPSVTFRPRLVPTPTPIDLTAITEACDDGVWFQVYSAIAFQNSKINLGPVFNRATLVDVGGNQYQINPPRYAGSNALVIDRPYVLTLSFSQVLADLYANEFLVPRIDAGLTIRDPFIAGLGFALHILDIVTFMTRPPDSVSATPKVATARIMSMDYGLDHRLLTLKVA